MNTQHYDKVIKPTLERLHRVSSYVIGKDYCWDVIRHTLNKMEPQAPWETLFSSSSLTLKNPKRGITIKVTTGCEVFVDRKIRHLEFKSSKEVLESIEAAADRFRDVYMEFTSKAV